LSLAHLVALDHLLQELDALGNAGHEDGVKEDVPHGSPLLLRALEFRLQLGVDSAELLLDAVGGEEVDAAGGAEDLHGDLLLVDVGTLGKLLADLDDQLLDLLPGVDVVKRFSSSLTVVQNELECVCLSVAQSNVCVWVRLPKWPLATNANLRLI
jgi:hypothetical protein